jgi:general secretion pathway protein J
MTHRPNGFTLVEMLVSLALLGALSMVLLQGFGGARRVWERGDREVAAGESVAAAQLVLRELVEHGFPWTGFHGSHPTVEFDGDSTAMEFLSVAPAAERPAPLQRYALGVGTDRALRLDVSAAERLTTPVTERRKLLGNVAGVEFAYFGSAPPDNSPRWRSGWHAQPQLPLLIRLRLSFASDDGRRWPDLVIRPAATLDSACVVKTDGSCKGR